MKRWITPLICTAMILALGIQSWLAVQTKCATVDEPLHVCDAYMITFERDFRLNPEDPPLWKYWAAIPHRRGELRHDTSTSLWRQQLDDILHHSTITTDWLYRTPANDGIGLVNRSRMMMLPIAMLLGAILATWSWQLGGRIAALVATFLYCFDPNFLGHAPLVKNDVAITLVTLGMAMCLHGVGRRVTWWNAALPGVLMGIGLCTKFSGVLLVPILGITLLGRAMLGAAWPIFKLQARRFASKIAVAAALLVASLLLGWAIVWLSYGVRFDPTPTPSLRLRLETQVEYAARNELILRLGRYPTAAELEQWRPSIPVRAVLLMEQHRVLPQAWLYGLTFTYQASLVRPAFLLGERRDTGWWYYFPLAMLFKTPMATLVSVLLAFVVLLKRTAKPQAERPNHWKMICLALPVVVYGLSALMTNLNLGLRHVLPLYPFLYILVGISAAHARPRFPRAFAPVASVIAISLIVESLAAFPNYISFFNAPSSPLRLDLLSDSNLDWGQDLPALAHWLQKNPTPRLYLAYFGTVDPAVYGISDYIHIPGGFWLGPPVQLPDPSQPGVLAISACILQGNNLPPQIQQLYAPLRTRPPRAIVGGSIYIYDFPPPLSRH